MALDGYIDVTVEQILALFDATSKFGPCPYQSRKDLDCLFLDEDWSVDETCMACVRVRGLTEKQLQLAKIHLG